MRNTSKNVATITIAIAIAALLVSSVLTMYTAEAKSKTGKIKVQFFNPTAHKGKLKIINERTDKVIVSADLNFDKQFKSQGDNCCKKTYEFKWSGNRVGDDIHLVVKTFQGNFNNYGTLNSGTTKIAIDVNGDDD